MLRSFARIFVSSAIFLLLPLFVQAQASSFSVGTASAAPGQKSTGYLEVPAGIDYFNQAIAVDPVSNPSLVSLLVYYSPFR